MFSSTLAYVSRNFFQPKNDVSEVVYSILTKCSTFTCDALKYKACDWPSVISKLFYVDSSEYCKHIEAKSRRLL
jgi:hypothetical protein